MLISILLIITIIKIDKWIGKRLRISTEPLFNLI